MAGFWSNIRNLLFVEENPISKVELLENRNINDPSVPITADNIHGLISNRPETGSGVSVTPESALTFSAVYSCVNIIAETFALLPQALYKKTDAGREKVKKHTLASLYSAEPNDLQTWFQLKHSLITAALLNGNGYALIERNLRFEPIGIKFLEPWECVPIYNNVGVNKTLYYMVYGVPVNKRDIIHVTDLASNGVIGKSRISLFREAIGLGIAAERFGASFYGNGANMSGILTTDHILSSAAANRIKQDFQSQSSGLGKANGTVVLEQGLHYERISISPEDSQFIQTRKFQVEEIARIFRVPLHKLQDLDRSTNNNIEHQSIEFVTDTMMPWVERVEQEFDRKLLGEREKGDLETEFDVSYLLRGDSQAQSELTKTLFATGAVSPDDIRERNGMNRKGGAHEKTYLQLGFAPLDENFAKSQEPATP